MNIKTIRTRLLASSMICGASLLAGHAYAAAAAATDAGPAEVTEVVVTGTRIPSPNLTSVSPVQVVTDKEIRLQGKTDVVDLVNNLPQQYQNSQVDFSGTSNPLSSPGGISTADLRGLGPQRTLVLVDGRRLGIGDANSGNTNPAPDLNQIPALLVDRVEVLTGGASSTYGSDAVAGVVNFIMKKNFDGFQVDAQYGLAQHSQHNDLADGLLKAKGFHMPTERWDGRSEDVSMVFGMNGADGKGNVTGYLVYHKQDPVSQGTRDFSACKINVGPASGPTTPVCSGSANSNQFVSLDNGGTFTVVGNQFLTWPQANSTPPALFNSNPYQYLQHDDSRYSAGFTAHYDISDNLKLYGEFSFMHDQSTTQVAPSGQFEGGGNGPSGGDMVNCNNPLLSAQQAAAICTPAQIAGGQSVELFIGRRAIESGARQSAYEHENYRAVFGVKGAVPALEDFTYDVYGQYYYTSLFQSNTSYLSLSRIAKGLQVVNVGGTPTCIAKVSGADPNCVPYNIFQDGGVTPAAISYLSTPGTEDGTIEETIVEATVAGNLGKFGVQSPWADTPVGVAFGVQDRRQHYVFAPDAASLSGDLSGFGGVSTAINARLGVTEVYGEARIPLVAKKPLVEALTLELGYRYSDYTNGLTADTYKVGGEWSVTEDVRFRASYDRAIRAPNIEELFNPRAVTNTSQVSADPCAGTAAAPATATLAQCINTGVTAAQYGNGGSTNRIVQCPAGQCAVLNGGNPNLQPEKADTYSVGVTVKPRFLPGFVGSVDFWDIKLDGTISTVPLAFTLSQCLTTGSPAFCSNVVRTPAGTLFGTSVANGGYIVGTGVNIGANHNAGVDFQASYNLGLDTFGWADKGSLQFTFIGSYLLHSEVQPTPGAHTYDCAGLYGAQCQTVNPRWRHTLRSSWQTPWDVLVSADWRYIGAAKLETNTSDPALSNGVQDVFDAKLKPVSYLDLAAIWNVRKDVVLRAGVNNVFDKDPQIISSLIAQTGSPNAYPTYDLLGRTLFVGLTANF